MHRVKNQLRLPAGGIALKCYFLDRSHLCYHIIVSHNVSLGLSWYDRLYLFLMTLNILRNTGEVFFPLNWDLYDIFVMIRLDLQVFGRKNTERKYHFYYIISSVCTINIYIYHQQYNCWCWLSSPGCHKVCQLFPLWSYSPNSFNTILFRRKSLFAAHI